MTWANTPIVKRKSAVGIALAREKAPTLGQLNAEKHSIAVGKRVYHQPVVSTLNGGILLRVFQTSTGKFAWYLSYQGRTIRSSPEGDSENGVKFFDNKAYAKSAANVVRDRLIMAVDRYLEER